MITDDKKAASDLAGVDLAKARRLAGEASRTEADRVLDRRDRVLGGADEQRDMWGDLEGYVCRANGRFRFTL